MVEETVCDHLFSEISSSPVYNHYKTCYQTLFVRDRNLILFLAAETKAGENIQRSLFSSDGAHFRKRISRAP